MYVVCLKCREMVDDKTGKHAVTGHTQCPHKGTPCPTS